MGSGREAGKRDKKEEGREGRQKVTYRGCRRVEREGGRERWREVRKRWRKGDERKEGGCE